MGRTLEQLFKERDIGGEAAVDKYAPQNPKDIRISSNDLLVNTTGFAAGRLARRGASAADITGRTAWEQELSGLRIIRGAASPVLYGNEVSRITLRATPTLDRIKNLATGKEPEYSNIEEAIQKATQFVNDKLGVTPAATPSHVANELKENHDTSLTQNRMVNLSEIRGPESDSTFLGKVFTSGGNLKTIGKQALGSLIDLGKDQIRGVLFSPNSTTPYNDVTINNMGSNTTFNYGSGNDPVGVTITTDSSTGMVDAGGLRYSKTLNLTWEDRNDIGFVDNEVASEEGGLVAKTPSVVLKDDLYSKTLNLTIEDRDDIIFVSKSDIDNDGGVAQLDIPVSIDRTRISQNPDRIPKYLPRRFGMDSKRDLLNRQPTTYEGETAPIVEGRSLDEYDLVPMKFYSVAQNKTVQFRATISGLSETYSPSWDSNKFIGAAFNYYTYTGIERNVSFEFTIFSLSADEHKRAWDRLNFLTSLVYPQGYYGESSAIVAPIIKFSLGDMYKGKVGFIENLSYNYDDNTPWQIDDTETDLDGTNYDMKGYKLPRLINVSGLTIKFIESRRNTAARRYYTFNPQT